MVSTPLAAGVEIPWDHYDEWYILDGSPPADWVPEVFVNYGGWTVVPAEGLGEGDDSWGDRRGLETLQSRFWEQLGRIDPVSYVAMGCLDVFVSRQRGFIERLWSEF